MKFHDYREQKPPEEGSYIWRVQHKSIPDLPIVFINDYRKRGAGFKTVLSPRFDHWNGYQVLLPKGPIWWAEHDQDPPKPGLEVIEIPGVENEPCPFCHQVPKWKYHGRFIGASPIDSEYWYLECCHWFDGFRSRMVNPKALAEKRNAAILGSVEAA